MTPGSHLEDWITEYIERRESDRALTPEQFAREHPSAGAELLDALRKLDHVDGMFLPEEPPPPHSIGPYQIHGEIGRGGMGQVLRAAHRDRPHESVALKILHPMLEQNPRSLERFHREGETLLRLRHPGLVRVLDTGILDSTPFIAMEYIEGRNLADTIQEARQRFEETPLELPPDALELPGAGDSYERAARIVARMARAVDAANREGVLHRDLKPRNIVLQESGQPIVIDFGLGRLDESSLTGSGDMLGTPQYMAPEQARGERTDASSDVYGLGVILRELVTLRAPRPVEDPLRALATAQQMPLDPVRKVHKGVPRDLAIIIDRATMFPRRWRTRTAADLAADLEALLEGGSIVAKPFGPVERANHFWLRHRAGVVASGALTATALIGFLVFVLWFKPSTEELEKQFYDTRNQTISAWLHGDLEHTERGARKLLEYKADDPVSRLLLALGTESYPEPATDEIMRSWRQAEQFHAAGRLAEALEGYHAVANLTRNDATSPFPSPLPLMQVGIVALELGEYDHAHWALSNAASILKIDPLVHRLLGETYFDMGKYQDALVASGTACRLQPDAPENYLVHARAAFAAGATERGLEDVTKAVTIDAAKSKATILVIFEDLRKAGSNETLSQLRTRIGSRIVFEESSSDGK